MLSELPLDRFGLLLGLRGDSLAPLLEGFGGPGAAGEIPLVEAEEEDELLSVRAGEELFWVLDVTQLFQSDVPAGSSQSAFGVMLLQVVALVRRHP